MQGVHRRRGLLRQIQVSKSKGVAVGHDGPHRSRVLRPLQRGHELSHPVPDVLHQQGVGGLRHGIKAQPLEQKAVFGLGVQKQVPQAPAEGLLPELGDDRGRQALALKGGVHGDAFADVAVQGAGGDDAVILQQVDGEGDGRVIVQGLPGQELRHGLLPPGAQGRAGLDLHKATSVLRCRKSVLRWRR